MIYSTFLVAVSAFAGLVAAQNGSSWNPQNPTLLPTQVDPSTRTTWCQAERNSCPELCDGSVAPGDSNKCDPNTLIYNCTCLNGPTPNVSDFGQTLPALMCLEWQRQCVDAHPNDADGQALCHSIVCGQRNATAYGAQASNSASSSRPASTSGGASQTSAGASGSSAASAAGSSAAAAATSSAAAVALTFAKDYGTGALGAALFALFGLAL